jgi:hypothetical protein
VKVDLDKIETIAKEASDGTDESWSRFSDATQPADVLGLIDECRRLHGVIDKMGSSAYLERLFSNATDHDHMLAIEHVRCGICGAEPGVDCTYGLYRVQWGPAPLEPAAQYPGKAHTRRLLAAIHLQITSPEVEHVRLEAPEEPHAKAC